MSYDKKNQQQNSKQLNMIQHDTIRIKTDKYKLLYVRLLTVVEASGTRDFQAFRRKTYDILNECAGCNVNERLRRLHERLTNEGATKSKIKNTTILDVIENDRKLKEIYTSIIKELSI